jgi:hypothetical protein
MKCQARMEEPRLIELEVTHKKMILHSSIKITK